MSRLALHIIPSCIYVIWLNVPVWFRTSIALCFHIFFILLLCKLSNAAYLDFVIFVEAPKSPSKRDRRLCSSVDLEAPVRVSMWRKRRLFYKAAGARVSMWRKHRHKAEARLSQAYMPVAHFAHPCKAPVLYPPLLQRCILYLAKCRLDLEDLSEKRKFIGKVEFHSCTYVYSNLLLCLLIFVKTFSRFRPLSHKQPSPGK